MQDLVRSQYRIYILCRNVGRISRKLKNANKPTDFPASGYASPATTVLSAYTPHSNRFPRTPKATSDHSSQGKARAKLHAYQNVRSRLIKEDGLLGYSLRDDRHAMQTG